jgi:O-acetylhomoserine/O-acetylserine sulfhydrylase-like pyridoxal-dependent enzyme
MKPATELIHRPDAPINAASLTTPIYETTTFIFETAEEVRDYNEGRSAKFLYTRYSNPTIVEALQRPGRDRHRTPCADQSG